MENKNPFRITVLVLTALLVVVNIISLIAVWWWIFELFTHFRLHYIWIAMVLLIIGVWRKEKLVWILSSIILILNLLTIVPYYLSVSQPSTSDSRIHIVSTNVQLGRATPGTLAEFIKSQSADVVFVAEATPEIMDDLQSLLPAFSERFYEPIDGGLGMGFLSRLPSVRDYQARWFPKAQRPIVEGHFEKDGRTFTVVGIHPHPPTNPAWAGFRNNYFKEIGTYVPTIADPIIMVGDYNNTSWSPYFQDLINNTKLTDSRKGFGIQTSWPDILPSFLRIPIDHALVSKEFIVINRKVGPSVKSDHRPIAVEVSW